MDIKTLKLVAPNLPADIAVLMRGPTGVGKSFLGKHIADEKGMPFIDVRGSTMSEGDVGGYPDIEGMKENGIMTFCMPSWFIRACNEPVVLMLDELNRSLPGVQQSFFQLVLDRELGNDAAGNPYRLHPETRIIAAVNHGAEYDVNEMDPALLRRFWVCDLEPTAEDWLIWAVENNLDAVLVDFIRQNPAHLRADVGSVEPGTVMPTPASWHRLDESLSHMGWPASEVAGSRPDGFYALAQGFVGTEAAIAVTEFVAKYEKQISAEDVMSGRVSKKQAKALKASESLAVLDKIVDSANNGDDWSADQADAIVAFAKELPSEQMVHLWNTVMATKNMGPIKALHTRIGDEIVGLIRKARELGKN